MLRRCALSVLIATAAAAADPPPAADALEKRVAQLEEEVARLKRESITYDQLYEYAQQSSGGGELWKRTPPDALVRLLRITPDERLAVERAVASAYEELAALIAA